MDSTLTATAIEIGWFLGTILLLNYSLKIWGAVKILWCTFALSSVMCAWIAVTSIAVRVQRGFLSSRALLVPELFSVLAAIYAITCWAMWKREPSARFWAIVTSVTYILLPTFTIWSRFHGSRSISSCLGIMLAIGLIGLNVFLRHDRGSPHQAFRPLHSEDEKTKAGL